MLFRSYIQSKENPSVIYVRMRDGRKVDAKAKTKFSVDPDDWSPIKGTTKHNRNDELRRLSKALNDLRSTILDKYNSTQGKVTINSTWLLDVILDETIEVRETPTGLLDYFDVYAADQKGVISDELYEKIAPNKARVDRFEKYMGRKYQVKDEIGRAHV